MSIAPTKPTPLPKPTRVENPDDYRMTLGDHLEELRTRLIWGLSGFIVAFCVALMFVRSYLLPFMCRPLIDALDSYKMNTQLYTGGLGDSFSIYLSVSVMAAVIVAGPWLIWQMWLFIASGLYPHERKVVTKFIPVSVGLFLGGVAFAYYVVMPMTLQFFLSFSAGIPLPTNFQPHAVSTTAPALVIPSLNGDPAEPVKNQLWFNLDQNRLKFFTGSDVRTVTFSSENLIGQLPLFSDYIDLLLTTLLLFGLSFQMPLVVMALVRVGIFELETMKSMRRIVYFILACIAALITPGDVITTTILLIIPLVGLYELGLFMARSPKPQAA
ncbi:MAG: twin-arginine translocase subunit TatC [Tepidisphaeraceae bacterium]